MAHQYLFQSGQQGQVLLAQRRQVAYNELYKK